MTKTMEALEKFAQALPPTAPVQSRLGLPRAADTSLPDVPFRTNQATFAALRVSGTDLDSDLLSARRDAAGQGDLPHAADPLSRVPRADGGGAQPVGGQAQACTVPSAARAGIEANAAAKSLPAVVRSEGLTRRGSHGQWQRLIGLSLLAVTIGVGFKLLVRASERAGEACWRQGIGKSVAHAHHAAARNRASAAR